MKSDQFFSSSFTGYYYKTIMIEKKIEVESFFSKRGGEMKFFLCFHSKFLTKYEQIMIFSRQVNARVRHSDNLLCLVSICGIGENVLGAQPRLEPGPSPVHCIGSCAVW